MHEAALEQDEMGWHATLEGRISTRWTDLQADCCRQNKSRRHATVWASHVVRLLWEFAHASWTNQCAASKEREAQEERATTSAALDEQIQHLHDHCNPRECGAGDRCLFESQSVEQMHAKPTHEKQTWMQAVSWASESQAEAIQHETTQARSTLRQWLQTD